MKKVPLRKCVATNEQLPKKELIRVVKYGEEINLDFTGKANGRGAYVCNDKECIAKLKKGKLLNRAFSCQVSDETYDRITETYLGNKK